jgi:hypothetical protein
MDVATMAVNIFRNMIALPEAKWEEKEEKVKVQNGSNV